MLQALDPGYNAGDMIYCYFPAYGSNGESLTITGLAVTDIEVYKDGSTTQRASDNGYTLLDTDGVDFDGSTGLHGFKVDTSDNSDASFWADGSHYLIWVDAVTINGQTVRFGFTCRLGVLLRPTTAGRKLDVSSGGEAGIDWANVGSPTTTVNLSGTTVKTATDVETDTADIQSRLPAALVGGRMDASVGAMANDVITAAAHDESTAFPLKSADSGSTQIARVGADGDTLETLSDQLDAKSSQASVDTLTTTVGLAGAGLTEAGGTGDQFTAIPWNASWDAEVQSEVQDAIEANQLDHLIQVADPGSIVANSSLWAKLHSKSATPAYTSFVNTTDSLEAIRDNQSGGGGGSVTVASLEQAAIDQLAGITVRVSQPFRGVREPLELVQGDDYDSDEGTEITVTISGLDSDFTVSGASALLTLQRGDTSLSLTATSVTRPASDVICVFEATAAQTATLDPPGDDWRYDVQITRSNGRKYTPIAKAKATVLPSYSA